MVTEKGLELIKRFEGFAAREYTCAAGKRTIGYGHVIRDGEYWPEGITPEAAENLLLDDVSAAEGIIVEQVNAPLSAAQFDALVSLVFNIGVGAFANSSLLVCLNKGDYVAAAAEFPRWCKVNKRGVRGLLRRRIEEMTLFLEE